MKGYTFAGDFEYIKKIDLDSATMWINLRLKFKVRIDKML